MKCVSCGSIIPRHYDVCPVCKGDLVKEEFAPQPISEEKLKCDKSAFVEVAEFEVDEE